MSAMSKSSPEERKVKTLDITVLAGGPGGERDVSLQSGAGVAAALRKLGHRVTVSDIDAGNLSALDRHADFVFIALHGEFGEDGALQEELERRGVPFNGSGAAASRMAMNKVLTKRVAQSHGIPTPAFAVVKENDVECAVREVGVPAMVKPAASGSSVDTSLVRTAETLRHAAGAVAAKYGEALVEQYITGRELTVGVLGDQALPPCEIRTKREFYNYAAKYIDNDTQYLFDIDLPADLLARVQALSLQAHAAIGCAVISRVDWMIDAKTMEPYLLEINTLPGFTSHSLVPKSAARIGISFEGLCQKIIELSLERHKTRLRTQ